MIKRGAPRGANGIAAFVTAHSISFFTNISSNLSADVNRSPEESRLDRAALCLIKRTNSPTVLDKFGLSQDSI